MNDYDKGYKDGQESFGLAPDEVEAVLREYQEARAWLASRGISEFGRLSENRTSILRRVRSLEEMVKDAVQLPRPIETAPHGERILIFDPRQTESWIVAEFDDDSWVDPWVKLNGSASYKPTHWLPLPPYLDSAK